MKKLIKKINNNHHKTSSDYISKPKQKNQMTSSVVIFKSNVMKIKLNNISNSKEGYISIPSSKASNGRSFDKELQDNKKIIKKHLKNENIKKESEKNTLEIESKEENSTNNLTDTLQYNTEMSLNIKSHGINYFNNNYNNYIYNNINGKLSSINNKNSINCNYIPTISINIKKNNKENKNKANIDAKTKSKKKKCLYKNNSNIIRKNKNNSNNDISNSNLNWNESYETFNKIITRESFDNKISKKKTQNSYNKEKFNKKFIIQNKDIQKTNRKLPNLTEDNLNNALLSSKCKIQNYLHYNGMIQNSNYLLNKKNSKNNNILNDYNYEYENHSIKNLINSKKKLFIKNKDKDIRENKNNKIIVNKENKNKENIGNKKSKEFKKNKTKNIVNNINLKKTNVLLLKSISVAQKLLRIKSPLNRNTMTFNNENYLENSNIMTQDLIDKDFYTMKINTDRAKEDTKNISNSNKNLMNNIKISKSNKKNSIKNKKDKKDSKTSQKYTITKKSKIKNIDNKNLNINIIITKKKKISQNNVVNSNNKKTKVEKVFDNDILSKNLKDNKNNKYMYFQNTNPIINKVLISEVGNTKKLNKTSTNTRNFNLGDLKNINDLNNNSVKNIILLENKTSKNINNFETTQKKNLLTDIIRKNIEDNKENKIELIDIKNSMINNINNSYFGENISTPINHKHSFNRKKKYFEKKESEERKMIKNKTNKISDFKINTNSNNNKHADKSQNMNDTKDSHYILNTPKLTERIIGPKLNIFEKIKNLKYQKELLRKVEKNKNFVNRYNEDESIETNEIINEKNSSFSNKIETENSFKRNNLIYNNLVNILFLDKKFLTTLFDFFDKSMINSFTLLNKKYYNCFKFIIYEKIKNKILLFYEKNNIFNNKIKLSLMKFSPLSKISPLLLHKKYIDLLFENENKYDKEIKKDLTRTFPDNSTFKYGNVNYNKLYHLLTVYSLYNNKIGYAQGLNFLAAHIIILFDKEEDALLFLDGLLLKFEFEKLIGVKNELDNKLKIIDLYIKTYCPEICKYLDRMSLSHEFFSTNWMLTLFSNSMDNKYLFIVWDFLIIFGWKFFRYFMVSILNIYKDNILEEEPNNLTFFMKNILRNDTFTKKFRNIINKTFEFMKIDNDIN